MRCKTEQREGSRSARAPKKFGAILGYRRITLGCSGGFMTAQRGSAGVLRKRDEINDRPG